MNNRSPIERLLDVMARLRDPDAGCPWDLRQTYSSIVPHTIEEAYEVAEAAEASDMDALRDELGDLLFQVVFLSQIAKEQSRFDFNSVADGMVSKLKHRHPHVFGDVSYASDEELGHAWEESKRREREARAAKEGRLPSRLDNIPHTLPAATRAVKLQKRAAKAGFDWPRVDPIFEKICEELDECRAELERGDSERMAEEIGDVLFSVINLARHLRVDPEAALRGTNRRFEGRFRAMENRLAATGVTFEDLPMSDLEILWTQVKRGAGTGEG